MRTVFVQAKSVQKITFLKVCDLASFEHSSEVKKGILLILGLLVLAAIIVGCVLFKNGRFGSDGLILTFSEEDIRERLSKKFPKTEKVLEVVPVLIEEPKVEFVDGSNRVRLSLAARIDIPFSKKYEASTIFSGSIRYETSDKTLRLTEVEVEGISGTNIPEKFEDPLEILMTVLARNYLDDVVVHEIKPKDLTNKAARWLLKKVEVRDRTLEVTLGL